MLWQWVWHVWLYNKDVVGWYTAGLRTALITCMCCSLSVWQAVHWKRCVHRICILHIGHSETGLYTGCVSYQWDRPVHRMCILPVRQACTQDMLSYTLEHTGPVRQACTQDMYPTHWTSVTGNIMWDNLIILFRHCNEGNIGVVQGWVGVGFLAQHWHYKEPTFQELYVSIYSGNLSITH